MVALEEAKSWITPEIANGGVAVVILVVVGIFIAYIKNRDAQLVAMQDKFIAALSASREACDDTQKAMIESFGEKMSEFAKAVSDLRDAVIGSRGKR